MKAGTGVVWPQAKEFWQLPEAAGGQGADPPIEPPEEL